MYGSKMKQLLPLLAAVCLSSCALQSTTPVHHLESGEFALSVAVTEPGFVWIPKLSLAATAGIGGVSDVTLGAGTSLVSFSGFGIVRFYTGIFETSVEANVQGATFEEDLFGADNAYFLVVTPRVGVGLTADQGFNYGLQATYMTVRFEDDFGFAGAYASYAWRLRDTPWLAFQAEFATSPFVLFAPDDSDLGSDSFVVPFVHLNFGATFWPSRSKPADDRRMPEEEVQEEPRPLL